MSRNNSLDFLRLVLALMVIALHTDFLIESSELVNYLLVNGIFRIAVPIFLIISGFYFYPVISMRLQLKWLKRVLILYLIWMGIYSYFWFYLPVMNGVPPVGLVFSFFVGYWHLWYVLGLLGAAIFLLVFEKAGPVLLGAAAMVAFLIGVAIQYAGNYHIFAGTVYDKLFNLHPFHRNALFFAFPFFCIGYLINRYSVQKVISFNFAVLGSLAGMALLLLESYLNFIHPMSDGGFDNFASLILVCPAIFILVAKCSVGGNRKDVSYFSSALYFVHVMVMQVVIMFSDYYGSILTFLVIFISVIFSLVLVVVNKKIKVLL